MFGSKKAEAKAESNWKPKNVYCNPNVIENFWKEGENPHCYFKRWRFFKGVLREYDVVRSFHGMEMDHDKTFDEILRPGELSKRARENFDGLTPDEQHKVRWGHQEDVKVTPKETSLGIIGWARLESNRTLEVFSVGTKDKEDTVNYEKRFKKLFVHISEAEETVVGRLMHWTGKLREYDDDDPGEDYLYAELYLKKEKLAELVKALEENSTKPELIIGLEAHLFMYEVDEAFTEHYLPQEYAMLYDTPTSIMFTNITLGRHTRMDMRWEDEEAEAEALENGEEAATKPADPQLALLSALGSLSKVGKQLRVALWVVVGVVIFAVLARR